MRDDEKLLKAHGGARPSAVHDCGSAVSGGTVRVLVPSDSLSCVSVFVVGVLQMCFILFLYGQTGPT